MFSKCYIYVRCICNGAASVQSASVGEISEGSKKLSDFVTRKNFEEEIGKCVKSSADTEQLGSKTVEELERKIEELQKELNQVESNIAELETQLR